MRFIIDGSKDWNSLAPNNHAAPELRPHRDQTPKPMPALIEDYALVGDGHTAALISKDGSIDWLCWPRFDSGACFAALLGEVEHGRWRIAPTDAAAVSRRHYRDDTMILETEFETAEGVAVVTDFMPLDHARSD